MGAIWPRHTVFYRECPGTPSRLTVGFATRRAPSYLPPEWERTDEPAFSEAAWRSVCESMGGHPVVFGPLGPRNDEAPGSLADAEAALEAGRALIMLDADHEYYYVRFYSLTPEQLNMPALLSKVIERAPRGRGFVALLPFAYVPPEARYDWDIDYDKYKWTRKGDVVLRLTNGTSARRIVPVPTVGASVTIRGRTYSRHEIIWGRRPHRNSRASRECPHIELGPGESVDARCAFPGIFCPR
jgi:hypothetical protein